MTSNKYVYPKPAESESWAFNSPQQDQNRKRRLPYKLLSFPSSKCSLWDHTTVGVAKFLNLFYQRHPRINIEKAILRSGHIFIGHESKNSTQMSCTLCGKLLLTEGKNQVVLKFTKLKFDEEIMKAQIHQQNQAEYQVPVTFSTSKTGGINFHQVFKEQAMLWLQNSIRKKDAVILNNFISCKAQCQFGRHNTGVTCNIQFCLVTLDARFVLKPILSITIILTALSRGLSDPAGNAFLHGEPKSGYVTMDETHRVLLVLDSDPKITSLPIVGIWIGGVETVQHPFVWASCIRYLNIGCFGKQICAPPDPFLVLVYEKPTFRPQFYDCILDSSSSKDGVVMYSGSCDSVLDQVNVAKPHEMREIHQQNCGQLSFALELMEDSATVSQKQSITPHVENKGKNHSLEGGTSLDKDLSAVSVEPAGYTKDICCRCSYKNHESFEKPDAETLTTNSAKLPNVNKPEKECMKVTLENSTIPNHNIYGLLLAQEQQLKQLKEQLGSLLHEKDAATLSAGCSPRDVGRLLCSKTSSPPRTVNSAGTMTSLAWPPLPMVNDSPRARHAAIDDNRSIEELPSPEIERKQAPNSEFQSTFLNSLADSLTNLQLPNFEESEESRQSSLVVDLHDYPESHASTCKLSDCNEFDLIHHNQLFGGSLSSTNTRDQLSMPTSASETEDEWAFYGNLLKKIQTILSHQESPDENVAGSNMLDSTISNPTNSVPSNERTSFDSLLIPHLNYVSMLPTDISSDQSLEFCSLALKYLNKCSTMSSFPSGRVFDKNNTTSLLTLCRATESNLSFASRQYLERHGISSMANDQHSSKVD